MKGYHIIPLLTAVFSITLIHVALGGFRFVNVCAYSNSPGDYSPKCYQCGNDIYTNALQACVNSSTMPRNITYKAADCMEKNCGISNYPTPPPLPFDAFNKFSPYISFFQRLIRPSRSVAQNEVEEDKVKEVETFVSKREITFGDMDYM